MRDVIQQIIEVEQQAKGILEAARIEAERIRSEARSEASRLVDEARRDGQAEARLLLESAHRDAEEEKSRLLAEAAERIEACVQVDEAVRRRAVERVVRRIQGEG